MNLPVEHQDIGDARELAESALWIRQRVLRLALQDGADDSAAGKSIYDTFRIESVWSEAR